MSGKRFTRGSLALRWVSLIGALLFLAYCVAVLCYGAAEHNKMLAMGGLIGAAIWAVVVILEVGL